MPANNAFLWGSRGSGKSTIVKALLNTYAQKGLRIIQVEKEDLIYLAEIFNSAEDQPYLSVSGSSSTPFLRIATWTQYASP